MHVVNISSQLKQLQQQKNTSNHDTYINVTKAKFSCNHANTSVSIFQSLYPRAMLTTSSLTFNNRHLVHMSAFSLHAKQKQWLYFFTHYHLTFVTEDTVCFLGYRNRHLNSGSQTSFAVKPVNIFMLKNLPYNRHKQILWLMFKLFKLIKKYQRYIL